MTELIEELKKWLDEQIITSETIGVIRRQCFVPWDSKWNSIVRDETAQRENNINVNPIVSTTTQSTTALVDLYNKFGGVNVKKKYSEEIRQRDTQ